jgi:hypothetical protein
LLYKGMDIYSVSKMLGDTVAVVEKHYARFVTVLRERALADNGQWEGVGAGTV